MNFVFYSGDTEFTVHFNKNVPNLTTHKLFYPDIKYLPTKIVGLGHGKNTMSLEEVVYGKAAVDSLLQLFDFEGYDTITDEELNAIDSQEVLELIEKFDRANKNSGQKG